MIALDEAGSRETTAQNSARLASIDALLRQLDVRVHGLRESWSGEAQASYAHTQIRWREHMDELRDVAHQLVGGANAAAEALSSAESAVCKLWTRCFAPLLHQPAPSWRQHPASGSNASGRVRAPPENGSHAPALHHVHRP